MSNLNNPNVIDCPPVLTMLALRDNEQQTSFVNPSPTPWSTPDVKAAVTAVQREDSDPHPKWANVPPGRAPFKPLPNGWRKSETYYAYGWAVTEEMIRGLLTKYKRPVTGQYIFDMAHGMDQLSASSGFPLNDILLTNGHFDYEEVTKSKMVEVDGQRALHIVAIGSTTRKQTYWPSPRQIRRLSRLLGDEPRWYKEWNTKENSVFVN